VKGAASVTQAATEGAGRCTTWLPCEGFQRPHNCNIKTALSRDNWKCGGACCANDFRLFQRLSTRGAKFPVAIHLIT